MKLGDKVQKTKNQKHNQFSRIIKILDEFNIEPLQKKKQRTLT